MFKIINDNYIKQWETKYSSLYKKDKLITYQKCRDYSCKDISIRTLHNEIENSHDFIIEIPKGKEFHFIGRVDTNHFKYNNDHYFKVFKDRTFASFSTMNNKNISRYRNNIFLLYNILPNDIAHVFPTDSCTDRFAKSEQELTMYPSIWLTLDELECLTNKLGVYDQITCKTKRNSEIIKPYAVLAIDTVTDDILKVAKDFNIKCVLIHPDEDAISYGGDLLYDFEKLQDVSPIIKNLYGFELEDIEM